MTSISVVGEPPQRRLALDAPARMAAHGLLRRLRHDALTIVEHDPTTRGFEFAGEPSAGEPLHAEVVVNDRRAYGAVMSAGSAGLGRGYVEGWWSSPDPVGVVRVLIRNMAPIDRWRNRTARLVAPVGERVRRRLPRDTRHRNREDISAHYDLGNDFFELFLDETMTYSSAVFPSTDVDLADASRHKYDLLLGKLGVRPGDHLLEIGTGWGGLAVHAASRIGCRVTTTTISAEQLQGARRRVDAEGLGGSVTLLDADWRDLGGSYDHVISIEMIEAVDWRDYGEFLATIDRCLAPGGRVAIQAICLPDDRWQRAKNTVDFIRRYVFPNGYLPSVAALGAAAERSTSLRVVDVEEFGIDYATTLAAWRTRFWANIDAVRALGFDDRFVRLWDFYLAYCEAAMRERHVSVAHLVLERPSDS